MKKIFQISALLLLTVLFTGTVFAHVTVNPREAVVGRAVFMVRVPNEEDVPTTSVRLRIPEGVTVGGIAPVPGWTHTEQREEEPEAMEGEAMMEGEGDSHGGESGRITEITWSGGRIGDGEFLEFPISVLYEGDPGTVTFQAYQTYSDGEMVPWDGSEEEHPAPVVTFLSESRLDSLEKTAGTVSNSPLAQAVGGQGSLLSIGAIILSVAALAMSMKKQ